MGIQRDSGASGDALGTTLTYPLTINGSNSARYLVVCVELVDIFGATTITSVTWQGTLITQLVTLRQAPVRSCIWGQIAPVGAVGGNIVVTASGSTRMVSGAVSLYGVNQAKPYARTGSNSSSSSANPSINIAVDSANDWVIDSMAAEDGSITATVGANQTEEWNRNRATGSNSIRGCGSYEIATSAPSVVMSWILSNATPWASTAIVLKPEPPARQLTLTGVGR